MSTVTLTLELPDDLAERFNAFATSRGLVPADALEALLNDQDEFFFDDSADAPPLRTTAEGLALVEETLEEIAAGKFHRFDLEAEKREALLRSARIAAQKRSA